jgi:hypothetical protein
MNDLCFTNSVNFVINFIYSIVVLHYIDYPCTNASCHFTFLRYVANVKFRQT